MQARKQGPTKRKAPLSDSGSDAGSDGEFPELDGVLSQSSDDESDVDEDLLDGEDLNGVNGYAGDSRDDDDDDEFDSNASSDESEDEALSLTEKAATAGADGGGSAASLTRHEAAPDDLNSDDQQPPYRVTKDAYGGIRYEYPEIDPVYDSDDSAREETNTIGNIPLSFYDSYPHIGYSIDGKKIMRPAAGAALDYLLDSIEVPKDWTGLTDPATGQPLKISQDERELLARIQMGEMPEDGYDPYPDTVEYFTSIEEHMPLSAAPEPKRRFVPSKHEAKRVAKLVRAIREGRILPYKPPEEREAEDDEEDDQRYDLWANEEPQEPHVMNIPAPKLLPPGHEHSVNPPEEYLPDDKEKAEFEAKDAEDREKQFLPRKYDSLRRVPAYDNSVKERFERCMDLYLAPRIRKNRLNIDPMSLLPKLPRPEQLKPYPTKCQGLYWGHQGRVRSVSFSPDGDFLASGGDDGNVCIWAVNTHLELKIKIKLGGEDAVDHVQWRPTKDTFILAAAAGDDIFIIVPEAPEMEEIVETSVAVVDAGFGYAATRKQETTAANGVKKAPPGVWSRPGERLEAQGVRLKVTTSMTVKNLNWHRRGDFFCSVAPNGGRSAVAIHQLSKHATQIPFRKLKGIPQAAQFHPLKPHFFVATKLSVRCYDLQQGRLIKTLQPGARHISSFDIHPRGDNVIVGSYDRRLLWHDLDLSVRPYKAMRFHEKAVRTVKFHKHSGFPLFADSSDDGAVQIYHGKVVSDLMENATIVPVKMLKGHKVVSQLGVLDIDWHPSSPILVTAAADGACGLWV